MDGNTLDETELAQELMARWDQGKGTSKSQVEIEVWGDATSLGRHFDRFVRTQLGVSTNRPSKQTDRIAGLERKIRGLVPFRWAAQYTYGSFNCSTPDKHAWLQSGFGMTRRLVSGPVRSHSWS
jgi:hypothetical protein